MSHKEVAFAELVVHGFRYLELDHGYELVDVVDTGGDPRDRVQTAKYRDGLDTISISYSESDYYVCIAFRFGSKKLQRGCKTVYYEPFMVYHTEGSWSAILPPLYPESSIRTIRRVLRERQLIIPSNLPKVCKSLASSLRLNVNLFKSLSTAQIVEYHEWYNSVQ